MFLFLFIVVVLISVVSMMLWVFCKFSAVLSLTSRKRIRQWGPIAFCIRCVSFGISTNWGMYSSWRDCTINVGIWTDQSKHKESINQSIRNRTFRLLWERNVMSFKLLWSDWKDRTWMWLSRCFNSSSVKSLENISSSPSRDTNEWNLHRKFQDQR